MKYYLSLRVSSVEIFTLILVLEANLIYKKYSNWTIILFAKIALKCQMLELKVDMATGGELYSQSHDYHTLFW